MLQRISSSWEGPRSPIKPLLLEQNSFSFRIVIALVGVQRGFICDQRGTKRCMEEEEEEEERLYLLIKNARGGEEFDQSTSSGNKCPPASLAFPRHRTRDLACLRRPACIALRCGGEAAIPSIFATALLNESQRGGSQTARPSCAGPRRRRRPSAPPHGRTNPSEFLRHAKNQSKFRPS